MSESGPNADQLQDLFTYSLDMLAIARDGILTQVNPVWSATLGWSGEQLTAAPLIDFVHPDDVDSTQEQLRHVAAGRSTTTFRNRVRHLDGHYLVVR